MTKPSSMVSLIQKLFILGKAIGKNSILHNYGGTNLKYITWLKNCGISGRRTLKFMLKCRIGECGLGWCGSGEGHVAGRQVRVSIV
jgi:hypothetical protein